MTVPSTIIFDLDGVIIDSRAVMEAAFIHAYREVVGVGDPPFAEYSKYLGYAFPDIMRIMGLPAAMHRPFVEESNRRAGEIAIYSGMVGLLDKLRACGFNMGIATGKDGKRARSVLETLGILDRFGVVLGSDESPRPKPAPDMALAVLRHFGASPDQAVLFGDGAADMQCGRAAGVKIGAVLWGEGERHLLEAFDPDYLLHRPGDIADILGVNCLA